MVENKDFVTNVLNIDREKPKPRKDIYKWSMFFEKFDYMFLKPLSVTVNEAEYRDFNLVVDKYKENLDLSSKEAWFENVKKMAGELGFATDNKEYKANPQNFKGNVATVCEYIRLAITGQRNSPDLYEIMSLLGEKEVLNRLNNVEVVRSIMD